VNLQVLQVQDLRVYYHTERGSVKAVDGVSFSLDMGERLGLVGESGCGKSTLAMTLMRLIKPPGHIEGGRIFLDGLDLAQLSEDEMRRIRLSEIGLIPQGAMNSLNPVTRIREQIMDGIRAHDREMSPRSLERRVYEVLNLVELERGVAKMYPHELSGGMKQRVCVAMAISLRPKVIVADEPTSALDVVVQRQVMQTIERLQDELGAAMILIGHDMGLMAQFAERLAVMYAGKLVEVAKIKAAFRQPLHPYTRALIESLPRLEVKGVFRGIPGITPSLLDVPPGCIFHPRCSRAMDICAEQIPVLRQVGPERWVACHLHQV
jgi:oligopeptide/dipeptide ABC transporter ATP-binding protein